MIRTYLGAFAIKDRDKLQEVIRTTLLREIAEQGSQQEAAPDAATEPRVSCMIGEKLWNDRWGIK